MPDLAASNEIPLSPLGSFGSIYSPVNESSSSDRSKSDNLCYISSSDNNLSSSSSWYEIIEISDMSSDTNSDFDMSSDTNSDFDMSSDTNSDFDMSSDNNSDFDMSSDNNSDFDMSSDTSSDFDMSSDTNSDFDMSSVTNSYFDMSSDTSSDFDMSSDTCPPAELSATEMLQLSSVPDSPLADILPLRGPVMKKNHGRENVLKPCICMQRNAVNTVTWRRSDLNTFHVESIIKEKIINIYLPIIVINACTFVLYFSL